MKNVLFMILTALALNATAQNMPFLPVSLTAGGQPSDLIQVTDSLQVWIWDTTGAAWINNYRYLDMVYGGKNNITAMKGQAWKNNGWRDSYYGTWGYDSLGNQTEWIMQFMQNGVFTNQFKHIYDYDASRNITSEIIQTWNNDAWQNMNRDLYTFDAANNMKGRLQQGWNGELWTDQYKTDYTYDAGNRRISSLGQWWTAGNWNKATLTTIHYATGDHPSGFLVQSWDATKWINSLRDTLAYDAGENLVSQTEEIWTAGAWVLRSQQALTYDANGFRESTTFRFMNNTGSKVAAADSTRFYFHIILGMPDTGSEEHLFTVSPNPNAGEFTVRSNEPVLSIAVFDLAGKVILSTVPPAGEKTHVVKLDNFAAGTYLVRIKTATKSGTGKILIH